MMGERLRISPVVVFISLFVWGWLLGGIGAILAVPLTMTILIVLDSFDATRWLVVLVRFAPEHTEGERSAALARVQGVWGRVRERPGLRAEPPEDGSSGTHEPDPADPGAEEALLDPEYEQGMVALNRAHQELSERICENSLFSGDNSSNEMVKKT